MTPRMQIVWRVLEAAKANNDKRIVALCRHCLMADRLGWKKYDGASAYAIVREFY